MKIGIFDPYLDSISGGERYMLTMAECLSKEHEVTILWGDQSILQKVKEKLGLDLRNIKVGENIFSLPFLQKLSRTKKYDILIILSDGSIPWVLSKKMYLHFQHPVEWITPSVFDIFKLKRVNAIICNSKFTQKFVDKKLNKKSEVLYPPIQTTQIKSLKKENIILTVGRFNIIPDGTDFKKQRLLISAFKKLSLRSELTGLKNWKFVIVTNAVRSDKEKLEEFIRENSVGSIEIINNLAFKKLRDLYGKAKIYWHAAGFGEDLEKNPERAEHFGISTVEAMSAGVVPIVINAGGQKEIVRENVNGFLWNTEEELLQKTHSLIQNESLFAKLSSQAIIDAQKFSQETFCKKLHEIIGL